MNHAPLFLAPTLNESSRVVRRSIAALAGLLALTAALPAAAQSGTWTNAAGGSWTATSNWSSGTIASGTGNTANFSTLNLTANATVSLNGARTIGLLSFGDTTPSHNWIVNTGSGGSLTLARSGSAPEISVTSSTTTINAVLAGTVGMSKIGAGTLALGAVNTYTAATQVSAGTLLVTGSLAAGTTTTVSSTGTLAGTGTLNGPVVINATLAPGNQGIGTLTAKGTLTLGSSSQTLMEISKAGAIPTADLVSGITTLTMGGTLTVTLRVGSEALEHGDTFTLFSATTRSGAFASVVLPTLPAGYS